MLPATWPARAGPLEVLDCRDGPVADALIKSWDLDMRFSEDVG
jgi:hypothetical protein